MNLIGKKLLVCFTLGSSQFAYSDSGQLASALDCQLIVTQEATENTVFRSDNIIVKSDNRVSINVPNTAATLSIHANANTQTYGIALKIAQEEHAFAGSMGHYLKNHVWSYLWSVKDGYVYTVACMELKK